MIAGVVADAAVPAGAHPLAQRQWRPDWPVDIRRQLADLQRGSGDPTHRWVQADTQGEQGWQHGWWRTCLTEQGPATLRLRQDHPQQLSAQAWGPGAAWALEHVPRLLGAADQQQGWSPHHRQVAAAFKQWGHLRLPRTDTLLDVVICAVLEQRVTGLQAWRAWRSLLATYGAPAPGPAGAPRQAGGLGMRVIPAVQQWRAIPSWRWHEAGVDPARAATLARVLRLGLWQRGNWQVGACPVRYEQQWRASLAAVPGVGPWTLAEIAQRSWGDADALSVGDYHLAANLGWALAGRPWSDEQMVQQLSCYSGHRHRVAWLLRQQSGAHRPRFGPRYSPIDYRMW